MTTKSLSEVKTHLTQILTEIDQLGESVKITRSGKPVGVLLPVDEYEGLMETLEILADTELMEGIRRGLEEAEQGEVISHEELWRELED